MQLMSRKGLYRPVIGSLALAWPHPVLKHGDHIGQRGTPGRGGSQPGFRHSKTKKPLWALSREEFESLAWKGKRGLNRVGISEDDLPRRAKIPDVNFSVQDMQDSEKNVSENSVRRDYAGGVDDVDIYEAFIPIEDLPSPKVEGGDNFEEFQGSRRVFPPIKVKRKLRNNTPEILDGNHRLVIWELQEMQYIPAWVVDERGHRRAVKRALLRGETIPESVLRDYPDLRKYVKKVQ